MLKSTYAIPALPPSVDLESVPVLKALATANRALAELKGRAATIPNQGILIDTLALQEGFRGPISLRDSQNARLLRYAALTSVRKCRMGNAGL